LELISFRISSIFFVYCLPILVPCLLLYLEAYTVHAKATFLMPSQSRFNVSNCQCIPMATHASPQTIGMNGIMDAVGTHISREWLGRRNISVRQAFSGFLVSIFRSECDNLWVCNCSLLKSFEEREINDTNSNSLVDST
jgi:hypothetical protein